MHRRSTGLAAIAVAVGMSLVAPPPAAMAAEPTAAKVGSSYKASTGDWYAQQFKKWDKWLGAENVRELQFYLRCFDPNLELTGKFDVDTLATLRAVLELAKASDKPLARADGSSKTYGEYRQEQLGNFKDLSGWSWGLKKDYRGTYPVRPYEIDFTNSDPIGETMLELQFYLSFLNPELRLTLDGDFGPATAKALAEQLQTGQFRANVNRLVGSLTSTIYQEHTGNQLTGSFAVDDRPQFLKEVDSWRLHIGQYLNPEYRPPNRQSASLNKRANLDSDQIRIIRILVSTGSALWHGVNGAEETFCPMVDSWSDDAGTVFCKDGVPQLASTQALPSFDGTDVGHPNTDGGNPGAAPKPGLGLAEKVPTGPGTPADETKPGSPHGETKPAAMEETPLPDPDDPQNWVAGNRVVSLPEDALLHFMGCGGNSAQVCSWFIEAFSQYSTHITVRELADIEGQFSRCEHWWAYNSLGWPYFQVACEGGGIWEDRFDYPDWSHYPDIHLFVYIPAMEAISCPLYFGSTGSCYVQFDGNVITDPEEPAQPVEPEEPAQPVEPAEPTSCPAGWHHVGYVGPGYDSPCYPDSGDASNGCSNGWYGNGGNCYPIDPNDPSGERIYTPQSVSPAASNVEEPVSVKKAAAMPQAVAEVAEVEQADGTGEVDEAEEAEPALVVEPAVQLETEVAAVEEPPAEPAEVEVQVPEESPIETEEPPTLPEPEQD